MPVGRYFLYIGSVLLALLFAVDWYLPRSDAAASRADIDRSAIRIHSVQKWPKAVVFDTAAPTIVPPAAVAAVAPPEPLRPEPAREAYAMAETAPVALPVTTAKPAKRQVRRTRVARNQGNDSFGFRRFAYRNDEFGFGFRNGWRSSW